MSTPTHHQLTRLLEAPGLERVVPAMAPETLHRIIGHCGLEACTELVALATPAQLTSIFDLDLWRHAQPGQDDQFDSVRFGEWLAALTDADAAMAARTAAALDRTLLVVGLSRFIRVIDPASAQLSTSFDDDRVGVEDEPPPGATCRVGGYQVTPIQSESWDAIVTLLVALEAGYLDCFHDVMRGCRRLSDSMPEVDGLDHLLKEPDQLLLEITSDREARRSRQGYGTAADARAFLQMARLPRGVSPDATLPNPIAAAYFRAIDEGAAAEPIVAARPLRRLGDQVRSDREDREARDAVAELLAAAGVTLERPRALMDGDRSKDLDLVHIRALLERLRTGAPAAYFVAAQELAFLTNVLVAGGTLQTRAFTPDEASRAVIATCNLGLEIESRGGAANHDMVSTFSVGWMTLHEQVAMFTTAQLIQVLARIRSGDTRTHAGLVALRRAVKTARKAAAPWEAREALDVLAILDVPTWTGLVGLTAECPTMPAVIDATLRGETAPISAIDFEFISTTSQIERIHLFVAALPHLLRD